MTDDRRLTAEDRGPRTEHGGQRLTTENCELRTGNPSPRPADRAQAEADLQEALRREACWRCCQNCAFALRPKTLWLGIKLADLPGLLLCFNHPEGPGEMRETTRLSVCRNFRFRYKPSFRLKAPAPPGPGICVIPLTKGKQALVDAEDYDRLMKHKWTASSSGPKCYAQRNEKGRSILMHREIMHAPKGMVVDHIDGNGLNNCKSNLRLCTQGQNICNSRPRGKTSVFKGVSYDKERGKYKAFVWENGATAMIGRYDDAAAAAQARDYRAVQLHGEFAYLNFPADWPKERVQAVYAEGQALRDKLEQKSDKGQVISDKRKVISDKKGEGPPPSRA